MPDLCRLTVDVRPGDHLKLDGGRIVVELLEKSGKLARLRVSAPKNVKIDREYFAPPQGGEAPL